MDEGRGWVRAMQFLQKANKLPMQARSARRERGTYRDKQAQMLEAKRLLNEVNEGSGGCERSWKLEKGKKKKKAGNKTRIFKIESNRIHLRAYIRVQQIALLLRLLGGRNHSLLGNNVFELASKGNKKRKGA